MSSASASSLLETLQSQLSTGDFDAANETFTQLSDAYATREPQEALVIEKSKTLRNSETISESLDDRLREFEAQYQEVELNRMSVLGGVSFYIIDPTAAQLSPVTSALSSAANIEESFQADLDAITPKLDDVDVPPQLNILNAEFSETGVFVGKSTIVSVTVQNLGGAETSDVTLEVTDSKLSVNPSTQSLGVLEAESTATVSATVSSETQGAHKLAVSTTSSNAGTASKTVVVSYTTPVAVLENRVSDLDDVKETVMESGLPNDVKDGLVDKLDTAIDTIERAISRLESSKGRGQPSKKALNTAINQLGAYLNQIDAVSDSLSAAYESRLRIGGKTNIDELAAVRAEI